MGTDWKDRTPEQRERANLLRRQARASDPTYLFQYRLYRHDHQRRAKLRRDVILDIANRKTNSQILNDYDMDYEDLQLIKEGKLPKQRVPMPRVSLSPRQQTA